jgi:hypothetical protein
VVKLKSEDAAQQTSRVEGSSKAAAADRMIDIHQKIEDILCVSTN